MSDPNCEASMAQRTLVLPTAVVVTTYTLVVLFESITQSEKFGKWCKSNGFTYSFSTRKIDDVDCVSLHVRPIEFENLDKLREGLRACNITLD